MNTLPPPPTNYGGTLVATAVSWCIAATLALVIGLSAHAYVTHAPPEPPKACIVTASHECPVQGESGAYTAYWIAWQHTVGLASPTPKAEGRP